MKSVSIVGLGWLGVPLGLYLRHLGWHVKGSKSTYDGVESMRLLRFETYYLELTPDLNVDPDDLSELLSADALVITIPPNQYLFNLSSYVQSIKNLVNEALLYGIEHIIFLSSTSVFPNQSGFFDEEMFIEPDTDIGKTLLEIENWLLSLPNVDCDVIRLGGLIGDDRHPAYSLAGRENISQGNSPVNLVHVDDCARAIQLLLEAPSCRAIYHLVAPQHPTKADYYQFVAKQLDIKPASFSCAKADPQRIILGDKICQELGFVYQYPDPYLMLPNFIAPY
ncbi:nucleoside-diphosphate-sugar epimerase [Bisgaardia hudsonensis]|uniref:Nucleoside-diphosphate-sugar epimerase n=1 Tax=Bisgaardia hudsonensis TaxID=109472 RepID=A0A4R2N2H0_9PAST|nr:SDR family oxidoreductase [Bisgaardia hudsonensis]QLB12526.1 NAD(P)-dependent oxidoreductase [Bisgaardia hudsonensis]TCP14066.1 nucleoside-diphosphate-sugar epimerase [Bisgaardia hudsonensis]